jgi:hypothetical protein
MRFDPDLQRRQSIRLPKMDYSRAGLYFVTICTHSRACIFGERIVRDENELEAIRRYIADNPSRWADDPENPVPHSIESFG